MPPEEKSHEETPLQIAEKKIEQVAGQLEVKLPKGSVPFTMRIITLILIIGGLGILGSVFTDFALPKNGGFGLHFYRLITGLAFLAVAYGLYIHQRWSLWLYGAIVLIGLFLNFSLAVIPAVLVIFLITQRKFFTPGVLDKYSEKIFNKIKFEYESIIKKDK